MAEEINITYFVHGTTIDNEKGISTGQAQGELSKLGIKQSKELKDELKGKKFDVVFSSDLKRAVDSAKIVFGDKVVQNKRLRECNYGDLNQAPEEKVKYEEHIDTPFPRGESLKDVEKRIRKFLDEVKKKYGGKNIAIISHKAPQLALEVLLNGKTWEQSIKEDWRKKNAWKPGWEYKTKIKEEKKKEEKQKPKEEKTEKAKEKEIKETKKEKKKEAKKPEKPKKTEAVVNAQNLPISTKYSAAICKFIKNKKTGGAIRDLEQVLEQKKAVPMKGEIPHRKGRIMSGRFPKKATEHFIKILKNLAANANANELENPIIVEAISNIGSRPFGRFGRIRRKRTHVKIKCIEKKK